MTLEILYIKNILGDLIIMDKELKDINKKLGELQKQFTRLERKINKLLIKQDIDEMVNK